MLTLQAVAKHDWRWIQGLDAEGDDAIIALRRAMRKGGE